MQIFITDKCPIKSAKYLDNKRVIKQVLETAQMLCTALNELAGEQIAPYKSTHKNHPCNVWARESSENWGWLYVHGAALCREYTRRYGKVHACEAKYMELLNIVKEDMFPSSKLTPFANCARNNSLNIDYTQQKDVHLAYIMYLNDRWDTDKREPEWECKINYKKA